MALTQYKGTIQKPGQRPEVVDIVTHQIPELTRAERAAGLEWVDGRYPPLHINRYGPNTEPGVTVMTAAIQLLTDVINQQGGGEAIFENEQYLIWDGSSPGVMDFSGTRGLTIRGNGAQFVSNRTNGPGQFLIELDDCDDTLIENISLIGSNTTLTSSTGEGLCSILNESQNTTIVNCRAIDCQTMIGCGDGSDPPGTDRVNGVTILNAYSERTYYGIQCAGNGDSLFCRGYRSVNAGRSYFVWNVRNHDVMLESEHGGPFTDCLLKAYADSTWDYNRLENIKLNYKTNGRLAAGTDQSADEALIALDVQQNSNSDPDAAQISGIDIYFDVATNVSVDHRRAFVMRRFDFDGTFDTTSRTHVFLNVRLSGRVNSGQNFIEDIVSLFDSSLGTWTNDQAYNFSFENIFMAGTSQNGIIIDGVPFNSANTTLLLQNVSMDIDIDISGQNTAALVKFVNVVANNYSESETSTNIADATATINTDNKFVGRRVWDTTNDRELRALGSGTTSDWAVIDGSASVTPS